jgi:uncharacterized protein (TIGR02246 family)
MPPDNDREAIHDATARYLEAVNAADVAGVMSVWADDGVLMPPHHPLVRGRAEIEDYFRRLFEKSRFRFVFTASEVRIDTDTAVERVEYTADAWLGGSAEPVTDAGKGLHVYTRRRSGASEEWKLTFDLWNTDQPRT